VVRVYHGIEFDITDMKRTPSI